MSQVDLMSKLEGRMQYLSDRQEVLTQNIANVDTPGYRAMDVAAPSFKDVMGRVSAAQMAQTSPMHLSASRSTVKGGVLTVNRTPVEVTASGNSVNLEDETRKAAQNVMDYQLVTNIYKKEINMLLTAAGKAR